MDKREKARDKARREAHALKNRRSSNVVKGAVLRYEDGTTETGLMQFLIRIRTTTRALKDLLYILTKFSLRAIAPVTRGQVQTTDDVATLLALRKLVAGTEREQQALEIVAPETWILYGAPMDVVEGIAFLDSSYHKGACTLLSKEYVETLHVATTGVGATGDWKPSRLPLPKEERLDDGLSMDKHERLTGKRFVSGPKVPS